MKNSASIFTLILLFSIPIFIIGRCSKQEFKDPEVQQIYNHMDTTTQAVEKTKNILVEEVKTYGIKKTLQINAALFLPVAIFLVLFLIWLKGNSIKK